MTEARSETAGREHWHLDKRVPVAIIATLVLQLVIFGGMYGQLENRVAQLERRADVLQDLPENVARLEERLIGVTRVLERIDQKLDRP